MKKAHYKKTITLEGLQFVTLVNNMAPVHISASQTEDFSIEVNYELVDETKQLDFDDLFELSFEDGRLRLCLEEISSDLLPGRNSLFEVKIFLPEVTKLELEGENYPFFVADIEADIDLNTENGPSIFSNCVGNMNLESENGAIKIRNHVGNINVSMENGPLSTDGLRGDTIRINSENGSIKMRSCSFKIADIKNENGIIYYETLPVDKAKLVFENENGVISLILPPIWSFKLTAETETGVVKNKLNAPLSRTGDTYALCIGDEDSEIHVKTENGVIKLSHDEHLNLDFLRLKLEQLKSAVLQVGTDEDREKIRSLVENIISYINRGLTGIDEENVRKTIIDAASKLKDSFNENELKETQEKLSGKVEKISAEIQAAFRQFVLSVQNKYSPSMNEFKEHFIRNPHRQFELHIDADLRDRISERVVKTIKKVMPTSLTSQNRDRQEIMERSRLKILQMLESGKITAEDAERLLKAIGKE